MHLSKDFKPPGVSDRLRFQSTAQMAMAETGASYAGLESPRERRRMLQARKIGNTKTSIHFGFEKNNNYETAMQAGDNYDRSFVDKVAGGDGKAAMTPHEMKMKLSSSNWVYGDAERDWKRASTLQDPTGDKFHTYRGILNEDVRDNIKSSNLYFGPNKPDFKTTAKESMLLKANDIDYAGDFKRARDMKKALTTSSLNLSTDEPRGPADYVSVAQSTMVYNPKEARAAQGVMNADMKTDLRAQHFQLGYDDRGVYETSEKERQRTLTENVQRRRAEIMASTNSTEDPDLLILQRDRERAKTLKQTLLCTSFIIGDNPDYM